MATTNTQTRDRWNTLHKNGPFDLKLFHDTKLNRNLSKFESYNAAATEIRRLIRLADNANERFRAMGSKWSLSSIAHCEDRMHYTPRLNLKFAVRDSDIHANSPYKSENIFLFQCGNVIKEISLALQKKQKSLKTHGASNGQTIAGCISTGVHGAAVDVGSVQDYVIGLNIITGTKPEDVIYLERASKPALHDDYIKNFKCKIIRDDNLFNAALVGLGSMGFIHGVVIEAEDMYLLHRCVKKIKKETALKLSNTLDFSNFDPKFPVNPLDPNQPDYKGVRPYHFKVYINQYNDEAELPVEFIYKRDFFPNYQSIYEDPVPNMVQFIYTDLIYTLIKFAEKVPGSIPALINLLKNSIMPKEDKPVMGKLWEIFWDAQYKGRAFACSFGVDHTNSEKALKVLSKVTIDDGPIPGIFAMRFVKQSAALLACTKFPFTCMIEIDGIQWKESDGLISLEEYSDRMIHALKQNNIPFTIHWGKNAKWDHPGLPHHMFGNDADKWKQLRAQLLTPRMQKVFSNKFLDDIKLS
ncbi:MAG: FAD-binding protein [Flavobacterium sp.]|nr:MAG: FAD-binding protein [Flavobacterium sp.]